MPLPPQGDLVRKQIDRKNLTIDLLADEFDMQRPNLHLVLSGQRKLPKRVIPQAAERLDIDEDVLWLTGGDLPPDITAVILDNPRLVAMIRKWGRDLESAKRQNKAMSGL